jgi:TolB protein
MIKMLLSWPMLFLSSVAAILTAIYLVNILWYIVFVGFVSLFLIGASHKTNFNSWRYLLPVVILQWGGYTASFYLILNKLLPSWNFLLNGTIAMVVGFVLSRYIGGSILNKIEVLKLQICRPNILTYAGVFCVLFMFPFGLVTLGVGSPNLGYEKMAFVSIGTSNHPEEVSVLFDGTWYGDISYKKQISAEPSGIEDLAWSPDGTKILFESIDGIYIMNANGGNRRMLLKWNSQPADQDLLTWSPDGNQMAFQSSTGIWTMDVDGENLKQINKTTGAGSPAWSPNGTKIAYVSDGIWIMNPDGSDQTRLLPLAVWYNPIGSTITTGVNTVTAKDPVWSPNGTKIAFSMNGQIWIMNANGSSAKPLTNNILEITQFGHPSWSPKGNKIAFESIVPDGEIWVMHADGTDQTRVSNTGRFPVWCTN